MKIFNRYPGSLLLEVEGDTLLGANLSGTKF
jgi:hypothetical protein